MTEPTRVRGKDEPSLIDLILTEDTQDIHSSIIHNAPLGLSDHCVLQWSYLVSVKDQSEQEQNTQTHMKKLNVNKGDYTQLNDLLRNTNWEKEFANKSLDESVDTFYELTKGYIDKCIPKMKVKPSGYKDKPPWMTKSAKRQIRKKKCAWQRYTQSKSYNNYYAGEDRTMD